MSDDDSSTGSAVMHQQQKRSTTRAEEQEPPPLEAADEDTLRILLSTDNHLGYAEKDPVRGMDSFAAFEEVLYLAKKFQCDFVLIAGDLFHDNRPSRRTLHKTMEIIRRYCMGPNPVRMQILSDQAKNFRNPVTGTVNYQDAFYSVDLPIFSIHGNHDDPSRDAGGELLAALDLLSISNLVNYFGRTDQVEKVDISPVLIQKGATKIALYGMGSMRDERLNRMWENKKVRFLQPAEDNGPKNNASTNNDSDDDDNGDDDEDKGFFNIFTLHQNRDLGRGSKNCVQESMIPDWMDLVVWGHEHECLIDFVESTVGTFRITQPGSSVATSLVAGEAVRKKVGILDIKGKQFRLRALALTQVRGFVTSEISLKEHSADLDPEDAKIDDKIRDILDEEVRLLAMNARDRVKEVLLDAKAQGNLAGDETDSPLKYKIEKPDEVLVRIRVEHSGFSSLNNQRFGARYVGEVANPSDILIFHRRKEPKHAAGQSRKRSALKNPIVPEELEQTNMCDLVMEQLEGPDRQLHILDKEKLSDALMEYVDKNRLSAISEVTEAALQAAQKKVSANTANDQSINKSSQIRDMVVEESQVGELKKSKASSSRRQRKSKNGKSNGNDDDQDESMEEAGTDEDQVGKENSPDDDEIQVVGSTKASSSSRRGAGAARAAAPSDPKRKAARRQQLLDDSDDDEEGPVSKSKKAAASASASRPKRTSSKRPASYKLDDGDDGDDSDAFVIDVDKDEDDDDDLMADDDDDDDDEPPAKKKRATKRAPAAAATKKKAATTKSASRKAKPAARGRNRSRLDSEDDDDDDHSDANMGFGNAGSAASLDDDWGTAATKSQYD